MFKTLVIDDERLAREELIEQLHQYPDIEVIAQAANAIEGLKLIQKLKPDVVFLDIQMPQITGIELLAMLDDEHSPYIIFVTAYDQYAIQAFEDHAFDYLLKPINEERLKKTIQRLSKDHHKQQNLSRLTPAYLEQIPCTGFNRILIVPTHEVEFAFSDVSGVHLQTQTENYTCQLTLKQLEEKTPLLRCHRQYLIQAKAIKEIKLLDNGLAEILTLGAQTIPVSRRYLKQLKEELGFLSN